MARVKTGLFLILWISAIIMGIFLGQWQLDRLVWKTTWLEKIDQAYRQPLDFEEFKNLTLPCTSLDRTFFIRMSGVITYDPDPRRTFSVKQRVVDGMFGQYVFTHATLQNGTQIWVNRGFVPNDTPLPPLPKTIQGVIQIRGTDLKIAHILKNNPVLNSNDLRSSPLCEPLAVIGVIEKTSKNTTPWPQPVGIRPSPPNDHLNYAIFWFSMSAIALIMGGIVIFQNIHRRIRPV